MQLLVEHDEIVIGSLQRPASVPGRYSNGVTVRVVGTVVDGYLRDRDQAGVSQLSNIVSLVPLD